MIVAIHQPNFLPWFGFFHKMARCDVFALIDHVKFTKGNVCNRNRIRTQHGEARWLTVPVSSTTKLFNETPIAYNIDWAERHAGQLTDAYRKAAFFEVHFPEYMRLIRTEHESLAGLNIAIIQWLRDLLEIDTQMEIASTLDASFGDKLDLVLNLCQHFDATTYLSGEGARKYNDESAFAAYGIELTYLQFEHPVYDQLHGEFVPNLSILDMLFHCGAATTAAAIWS